MNPANTHPSNELTQSQLLLWAGQQMLPDSPMYNMVLTYRFRGRIEVAHFQRAFKTLVNASDAFRTVFELVDGRPRQRVLGAFPYELPFIDWSAKEDAADLLEKWLSEKTQLKFDLSKCLCDSALIRLADNEYLWYFNKHHLVTDAWSFSVIYKEMERLYKLSLNGQLEEASELPSFFNYVKFEQAAHDATKERPVYEYWKNKLDNRPPLPRLYYEKAETLTSKSQRFTVSLGEERLEKLKALATEQGIRSFTQHLSFYYIFTTTLFAFIHRISGQRRFAVGSPAHNRPTAVAKETIGLFIETLPLFADVDPSDTFMSLMKKVQAEVNAFLRNAQTGVGSADLSRCFNVFLNYINATFSDFYGLPTEPHWIHPDHCDPAHHLRVQVWDYGTSDEILLSFDLNEGVFNGLDMAAVPQHFLKLLDAFIENKDAEITAIPLLTQREEQALVADFNDTKVDYSADNSIIEIVERQAVKTPEATCIVFEKQKWTYREVNEKVNQLAHYFTQQGLGLGKQVGICLKRSPEYIISVLAAQKAGATHVPIPNQYPNERIYYLLNDSQASLLVTDSSTEQRLDLSGLPVFNVDEMEGQLAGLQTDNLSKNIPPESVAFLIYTSGSTGNPKGVMITNEAMVSYIQWTKAAYIKVPEPAIPLFSTIGFDITMNSVFLPLICGGAIHVYQEKDGPIDLSILDVVADGQVDFIKLTPAHAAFLKGKNLSDSRLKVMVVTGDEFKTELGHQLNETYNGKIAIYNEYGPSEATIGCIYHPYSPDIKDPSVPIGKPIHNMEAYILDRHLNPVPKGVVGDLYLGGIGLAKGYWNRPELTAEKFIESPFRPNAKLYKTGDLARINKAGIIEFLGRTDFQVKINGYRIELGEIESRIADFGAIKEAVVLVKTDHNDLKHLTAFFTSERPINIPNLREHLAQHLPNFMIPTHFRLLDVFPLSPNGKVDRKALKDMEAVPVAPTTTAYQAPQTDIEEALVEIWQNVLGIPRIGIHDNFLEIGGDSLRAIQITSRMNEAFELDIPIYKTLELLTVFKIGKYVEEVITRLLAEME